MSTTRRGGRPWRRVVAYVIARDNGICHLCGNPGADTGDHIRALEDGGDEYDPDNVKPAHGRRRTLEADGFTCPGNYAHPLRTPRPSSPHSRPW